MKECMYVVIVQRLYYNQQDIVSILGMYRTKGEAFDRYYKFIKEEYIDKDKTWDPGAVRGRTIEEMMSELKQYDDYHTNELWPHTYLMIEKHEVG